MSKQEKIEAALRAAKIKLAKYRDAHGPEYVGGMEYTSVVALIDAALSEDRVVAEPVACIILTWAEIQSGHDRQKWAEGLIKQLPPNHDGRNSWLLNYGIGEEAVKKREDRKLTFNNVSRAIKPPAAPPDSAQSGKAVHWHGLSEDTAWLDGRDVVLRVRDMEVSARYCPGEWSDETPDHPREYDGAVWSCFDDQFQIEIEECSKNPREWCHNGVTHWREALTAPGASVGENKAEALLNAAMDHIAGTLEQPSDDRAWSHLLIYCPPEIIEERSEQLRAARTASGSARDDAQALLDRLQRERVLLLDDKTGVMVGGRWDGWRVWRHPDGQWVTAEKLKQEAPLTTAGLDTSDPTPQDAKAETVDDHHE